MPRGNHDASYPAPCANPGEKQVTGDLQHCVGEKKQPGPEAECGCGKADIHRHGRFRHANIGTINKADDVRHDKQRHQMAVDFFYGCVAAASRLPPFHLLRTWLLFPRIRGQKPCRDRDDPVRQLTGCRRVLTRTTPGPKPHFGPSFAKRLRARTA